MLGRQAEALGDVARPARPWPTPRSSAMLPPAKSSGSMGPSTTLASVTVGSRAAAAVAGRAGLGAGALRPDRDALQRIDAARSSRRRRRSRPSRSPGCAPAGREPLRKRAARSTSNSARGSAARSRRSGRSWPWCRPCRSDSTCASPRARRDLRGEDRAAGRAGFDQPHRERARRLDGGQAAARGHEVDRASELLGAQRRLACAPR